MIRVGIMQPYFFPYIGYFQLMAAVDRMVVYDNIEYTKKGWINRNRFLLDGAPEVFTVPLARAPDKSRIDERRVAADFDRNRLLNRIREAYRRAPHFHETFALFDRCVRCPEENLFRFLLFSIRELHACLGLTCDLLVSSAIDSEHALRGQDRVIALCRALGADVYLNPAGGSALYSGAAFRAHGIELSFLRPQPREYPQFGKPFVPLLSILDVLMFNSVEAVREMLAADRELSAAATAR